MTKVDFYILPDDSDEQRLLLTCRLLQKAQSRRQHAYVNTADEQMSGRLDELLWDFQADSFIPHRLCAVDETITAALPEHVLIGHGSTPDGSRPILINLADDNQPPPFFSRFERTLEIVNQQQQVRAAGRRRYSFYQQHAYQLQHHSLNKKII